jgi:hypothetical protein
MARWPTAGGGPGQLMLPLGQLTSGRDSGRGSSRRAHGRSGGAVVDGRQLGCGGGRSSQAATRRSQGRWPTGWRGGRASVTRGGGGLRHQQWLGRQGPKEVVDRDVDGGPSEDGGPEARTMIGRRQDAGGQERQDVPRFRLSPLTFIGPPLSRRKLL